MPRIRMALYLILLGTFIFPALQSASVASISGTKCSKVNSTKIIGSLKYTCVKSGKKLIWNKGVTVKVAPTPTPTSTPTPTPTPTPTSTPTPTPTSVDTRIAASRFDLTPANGFLNLEICKIRSNIQNQLLNNGFPRSSRLLHSTSKIRGVAIIVDFNDLPATGDEIRVWKTQQVPTAKKYFSFMSYGKLDFDVDVIEKVFRIPKSVLSYNLDTPHGSPPKSNADALGLIKDAIAAADSEVDFSKYDFVNAITPETNLIGFEGSLNGAEYSADGKTFFASTFGPIREYKDDPKKYPWLVHETGHLMGLIHPYNTQGNYYKNFGIIAWDLMGNAVTFAPEFLAWHKFLLGWFESSQVHCLDSANRSNTINLITPISDVGSGLKSILVKVSETKILVIENRRASDLNSISREDEGVIVYVVDGSIEADLGAVTMIYARENIKYGHLLGTLLQGEKVSYQGISVEVLSSASDGDFVKVTT